ncbi:MAG TPA: hypothetical protein VKQ30_15645 [Ktedonobacterales bacterium]|nr:hypothetical protein [Ktedonobacterales bacterium]
MRGIDRDNLAGYVIIGIVLLGALVWLAAALWMAYEAQHMSA